MAPFAHLFGIRPWELDLLTRRHYELLKTEADLWLKARGRGRGV